MIAFNKYDGTVYLEEGRMELSNFEDMLNRLRPFMDRYKSGMRGKAPPLDQYPLMKEDSCAT